MSQKFSLPAVEPAYAQNQKQLAEALGVSRQLVAYHAKLPGNPGKRDDGRYPIAAWRSYFLTSSAATLRRRSRQLLGFEDGALAAHDAIAGILPEAVRIAFESSGVMADRDKIAEIAVIIYLLQASATDRILVEQGCESVFAPDSNGELLYPAWAHVAEGVLNT